MSTRLPLLLLVIAALGTSACLRDNRAARQRGAAGVFENTQRVEAPEKDRCTKLGRSSLSDSCEEARGLAQVYVRRLHPGDEVCLEGGFGEVPGAACLARAAVANTGENEVLLEVREAKPGSRWFSHEQHQVWFEEGALVDLYLSDQGY